MSRLIGGGRSSRRRSRRHPSPLAAAVRPAGTARDPRPPAFVPAPYDLRHAEGARPRAGGLIPTRPRERFVEVVDVNASAAEPVGHPAVAQQMALRRRASTRAFPRSPTSRSSSRRVMGRSGSAGLGRSPGSSVVGGTGGRGPPGGRGPSACGSGICMRLRAGGSGATHPRASPIARSTREQTHSHAAHRTPLSSRCAAASCAWVGVARP
jgi:hypothetical protein